MAKKPGKWLSSIFGGGKRGEGPVPPPPSEQPADEAAHDPVVTMPAPGPKGAVAIQAEEEKVPLEWQVGDVILDLYEVKHIFSTGGMGLVYRVHHRGWNMDLAVKSPRAEYFKTEAHKENFARECESWINLGLHPNMVSCHYVRTLGGIPRVFAEYVEGGSLQEWIKDRRLYEGGHDAALERMLDVAIQFAWGLQYAHDQGLVHQDVKPANVLMGTEGAAKVKVTDFGLARARAATDESSILGPGQSPLVTTQGCTPAYRSPEQAYQEGLTHKTDIWSWAVSVLEMFNGEVTWSAGEIASDVLNSHLDSGPVDASIPKMPEALVELLRRCFARNPDDRPEDMHEIVRILTKIYEDADNYQDKEKEEREYVRAEPKAAELLADGLNNRAVSLLDLGMTEAAEGLLEQAVAAHTGHLASTYNFGLLEWRAGRIGYDAVLARLRETELFEEAPWQREVLMARVLLEADDCEGAAKVLEGAEGPHSEAPDVAALLSKVKDRLPTSRRCVRTFEGHTNQVTSVCLSSDARWALSGGSYDFTLRLWEVSSGRCVRTFNGHKGDVCSVCLSSDGHWALSGSGYYQGKGCTLKLWEVSSGRCVRTYEGHTKDVSSVCLSSDGRWALSGSHDHTLKLWEVSSGRCLRTFEGHTSNVNSVCLSSDGRWALSGSGEIYGHEENTLRLWEVSSGRCVRTFEGHTGSVRSVYLSSDGRWALSGSGDHTLKLWEVSSGRCVRTFEGHESTVYSVCLSSNGRWVLSGSWYSEESPVRGCHTLKLWEVSSGRCVRTFDGHDGGVYSVCLSFDARWALSGSSDNTLKLWEALGNGWDLPAKPEVARPMTSEAALAVSSRYRGLADEAEKACQRSDFASAVRSLRQARALPGCFRRNDAVGRWVGLYRSLPCVRFQAGWAERTFEGHTGYVNSVCLSSDGRWALSGSWDDTLKLWEVSSGRCVRMFEGHENGVSSVCLSSDGRWALSGSYDKTLKLWEVSSGRCVRTFEGHTGYVSSVCLSSDARWALSGSEDRTLKLWEVSSGRCLWTFGGHESWAFSVCLSSDGRWALSGSSDETLKLWEVSSGRCVRTFEGHTGLVYSVCLSSDGRWALSGSSDETLKLWEVSSGRCVRTFEGHKNSVRSVCLSSDGRWALSGSGDNDVQDNMLKLWEVSSGRCVRTFEGHKWEVYSVCLSSDGRWALSGSGDNTLKLWALDWELEERATADWDDGAEPYLEIFLTQHMPYRGALPDNDELSEDEIAVALTRRGKPSWTDDDFKQLLCTLGCAGYGWLRPEGVKRELEKMAGDWNGPPPLFEES